MSFKIEHGVAIPKKRSECSKYPFNLMGIGDSVLGHEKEGARIAAAASVWGKLNGKKFISRKVEGGVRVWRTA